MRRAATEGASHAGARPHPPPPPPRRAAEFKRLRGWLTLNDPAATAKYLRHAERIALELGVADDVAAFDEAAKAFPNAPPIIVAM